MDLGGMGTEAQCEVTRGDVWWRVVDGHLKREVDCRSYRGEVLSIGE
jgi:hypothetical protein